MMIGIGGDDKLAFDLGNQAFFTHGPPHRFEAASQVLFQDVFKNFAITVDGVAITIRLVDLFAVLFDPGVL
nr:hypothetical protein [Gimesia chilikensis]